MEENDFEFDFDLQDAIESSYAQPVLSCIEDTYNFLFGLVEENIIGPQEFMEVECAAQIADEWIEELVTEIDMHLLFTHSVRLRYQLQNVGVILSMACHHIKTTAVQKDECDHLQNKLKAEFNKVATVIRFRMEEDRKTGAIHDEWGLLNGL